MTSPASRGDRSHRAAQVVRRQGRPRRHRLGCPTGTSSRCSAPTARARPPPCGSCPRSSARTAARRVAGHDVARDPDAVRAAIGVTGQFSAVDNLLTGEENLLLMADLHHLGRAEGRRRAAALLESSTWPRRRGNRPDLLGRDAAKARPGDDPDRRPARHLPRRADHRPRPARPPHHVGDHPRARRRRRHDLPDHAVPGGGRRAGRPDRRSRPRQVVAEGTPDELKRSVPGGHVRLRFADAAGLDAAPRALGARPGDDDALTLQVPSDGGAAACGLLDRLDDEAIEVDELSVHTPDLDDVFFALTGPRRQATPEMENVR